MGIDPAGFDSAAMLRSLGGVVSAARPEGAGGAPAGNATFGEMLKLAKEGKVSSGLRVRAASGSGVEMTEALADKLSAAADAGEIQGATRALVVVEGQGYVVDIGAREVTGLADLAKPGVTTGFDAFVVVPSDAAGAQGGAVTPPQLPRPSWLDLRDGGEASGMRRAS